MIDFSILLITDSRDEKSDISGKVIENLITENGQRVVEKSIVGNDAEEIRKKLVRLRGDIIITVGGTGISGRDRTPDVIKPLLSKELPGFGELFRSLSYGEIGTSTMMSRSFAGVYRNRIVVSLPGSTNACTIAIRDIILKECEHMLRELRKE